MYDQEEEPYEVRQFVPYKIKDQWKREQLELKKRLILYDNFDWYLENYARHKIEPKTVKSVIVQPAVNKKTNFSSPQESSSRPSWSDIARSEKYEENFTDIKGKNKMDEEEPDADMDEGSMQIEKPIDTRVPLRYVGGVDLSFSKRNNVDAVASLVILSFPQLEVVYELYEAIKLTEPYIAGYLAFREVPHLVKLVNELKANDPDKLPQVIMVDGNGILHYRGFGLACHLGVLTGIPTIGVAKKLLCVDGLTEDAVYQQCYKKLRKAGQHVELIGNSGTVHGAAVKGTEDSNDPIFVSAGHRICLETSLEIVKRSCHYRIPEPTRQADLRSRKLTKFL